MKHQSISLGTDGLHQLAGRIFKANFVTDSVVVYIYREQVQGTVELVDSVHSYGKRGEYSFDRMVNGTYYVRARLFNSATNFIDTYYGESAVWIKSKAIILRRDMLDRNINLLIEGNGVGAGYVSGSVVYGETTPNPVGSGAQNIPVVLISENHIVNKTFTDAQGNYEFKNIPVTDYEIVVDYPGKSMTPFHIDMNTQVTQVKDLEFVIEKSLIYYPAILSEEEMKKTEDEILVYPNPAEDYIQIRNAALNEKFQILNVLGEVVRSGAIEEGLSIDITELESGNYIIQVDKNSQIQTRVFIKK